jgi:hypothetical protein
VRRTGYLVGALAFAAFVLVTGLILNAWLLILVSIMIALYAILIWRRSVTAITQGDERHDNSWTADSSTLEASGGGIAGPLSCKVPSCFEPREARRVYCAEHGAWTDLRNGTLDTPAIEAPMFNSGDAKIVCPHCGVTGQVKTRRVKVKSGISGGKATGALLTGGLSLLGTGLSRKVDVTQATCGNCRVTWTIA